MIEEVEISKYLDEFFDSSRLKIKEAALSWRNIIDIIQQAYTHIIRESSEEERYLITVYLHSKHWRLNNQWRGQPDNSVPLCKFKIVVSLFISLEIDCFHSQ
jgi:hypothetical protein